MVNSLLENFQDKRRWVVRSPLESIPEDAYVRDYDANLDDIRNAIRLVNGEAGRELVLQYMKKRYAVGIKREKVNPSAMSVSETLWTEVEYYLRSEEAAKIDTIVEAVNTGTASRLIKAIASLANAEDQSWRLIDPDENDVEDAERLLQLVRERGGFQTALESLDVSASTLETSFMHIRAKGYEIQYDVVTPDYIWFVFGGDVTSYIDWDGKDPINRPTDRSDINDASAVIIQVGSDSNSKTFLAYVGGTEDMPDGRMVTFSGQKPWPIPKVNEKSVLEEYRVGETECNPLTFMMNHGDENQKQLVKSEYPIVKWRGGHRNIDTGETPITTSIYEDAIEIELAWSLLLRYSTQSARGIDVFTHGPNGQALPKSLEVVVLQEGQTYNKIWGGSGEVQAYLMVVKTLVEQIAAGRSVPAFLVSTGSEATPASGISLAIQSQPLIQFRAKRYELNKPNAAAIFDIERALISYIFGSEGTDLMSPSIVQKWDCGTWTPPQDERERVATIIEARDGGLVDNVGAQRIYGGHSNDAEAISMIETMQEHTSEGQNDPIDEKKRVEQLVALRDAEGIDQIEFLMRLHGIDEEEAKKLEETYKERDENYGKGQPAPQNNNPFGFGQ